VQLMSRPSFNPAVIGRIVVRTAAGTLSVTHMIARSRALSPATATDTEGSESACVS
jgi:hypothetical protein